MDGIAIVRNYYECFNRQDWPGMVHLLAENIAHFPSQGDVEIGKPGFERFLAVMDEHYSEWLIEFNFMSSANGRRVAAEFICNGKYLKAQSQMPEARGQSYSIPVGAFFELNEKGEISRISNHYNMKEWLRQITI